MKAGKFKTDKSQQMLDNYDRWFRELKSKDMAILELGVLGGGSLLLWNDYFKRGKVAGLDMETVEIKSDSGRIKFYQGQQDDKNLLKKIAQDNAPKGFDIIIDDASHYGRETKQSFWYLIRPLPKKGRHLCNRGLGHWVLVKLA